MIKLLLSHRFWIFAATFFFTALESSRLTRFGATATETLSEFLGFAPADPFRQWGLTLLTYALVHVDWGHWVSSFLFWFVLAGRVDASFSGKGLRKQGWLLLFYPVVSFFIALSFILPSAPSAMLADRVLGLSALVLFQTGLLLFLQPPLWLWLLLPVLGYFVFAQPLMSGGSALSLWGHGAGFAIGLLTGALLRFAKAPFLRLPSNEAFASPRSYRQ